MAFDFEFQALGVAAHHFAFSFSALARVTNGPLKLLRWNASAGPSDTSRRLTACLLLKK